MRYLSLFSGIEAASVAWLPLGWECVGVAEIAPFPCRVLAHHYPDVPNLGSVTDITAEQIAALGPIDLVVGGFPCQDLSIAGKQRGLSNDDGSSTRSGLFFDAMRIVRWAAPRWLVIENVPGMLSSSGGEDFRRVVSEMAGAEYPAPDGGWRSAGAAAGPDGLVEWRTLDAQWFGVAQRRRRVFLVRDSGDWLDRPPVLLEPESLCRNPPSREEARQDDTRPAARRARERGGEAAARRLSVADVTGTLVTGERGDGPSGTRDAATTGLLIPDTAPAMGARAMQGSIPTDMPEGFLIPDVANPLTHRMAKGINTTLDEGQTIVVHGTQDPDTNDDLAHPLPANNGGAVAFATNQRDEVRLSEILGALPATPGGTKQMTGVLVPDAEPTGAFAHGMTVRRLSPVECARLQGFPDDYLDVPDARGKPAADTPKYSALGNSMAVPCMKWIAERIELAASNRT